MPEDHLVLDLSGADDSGFDPIDSGTYHAEVARAEMRETKNAGKLPKGTPMIAVGFKITDEQYENRWVWRNYIVAPAKVGSKAYEHKAKMDGMLVRFLTDIGYDPDEVKSSSFAPDLEDFVGRTCRVVVGQRRRKDEATDEVIVENEVKGTKPPSDGNESTGGLL